MGVGSAVVAAVRHGRRGAGAEIVERYAKIARERIDLAISGMLPVRPMGRPKYDPKTARNKLTQSPWGSNAKTDAQLRLLQTVADYEA